MSWRRSGPPGGQQATRTSSGSNTPRDRANTPSTSRPANPDGAGQGRGQGQGNQRGGRRDNTAGPNNARTPQSQQTQPQADAEAHVPVNGFNANEVKEYMKKCEFEVMNPVENAG
jgi:hypothetical protein